MTAPRMKLCALALAAAATLAGCSRPDANAPVRITGDKDLAIPSTAPTTATSTTSTTTTTLYYGPGGAGTKIAEETTTTAAKATTTTTEG